MIGNTHDALPQNGISQADILYEILVEGGMTRFMAVFQDYSRIGTAGSIRSARHYIVEIVESYDAIYLSAGGSPPGINEIKARNITHYSEGSSVIVVNRNRVGGVTYERMHSLTTSGELLTKELSQTDKRLEHEEEYEHAFTFTDDATPAGGLKAQDVAVRFSSSKSSSLKYDTDRNVYFMRQYNRDLIDANNGKQLSFSNILVLVNRDSALQGQHAGAGRRDMTFVGSGEGFFVHGGKYIEIEWSRADKSSQFVNTLKDGSRLELGRGKTYICVVPTNTSVVFS